LVKRYLRFLLKRNKKEERGMKKEELREKIREEREKERIRDALRARRFSNIKTFEQGLSLIDFAIRVARNAKHA